MKCVLLLAVFFAFIAYVQAGIKIVDPIGSTTWTLGSKHTIKWEIDTDQNNKSPETGAQPLEILYYAPGETSTKAIVFKTQVPDVSNHSFSLDLSTADKSKFPSTGKYCIRIGGESGTYSAQFTINGGTGSAASVGGAAGAAGAAGAGAAGAGVAGAATTGLGAAKTTGLGGALKSTTLAGAKATATKTLAATGAANANDAKTISATMALMAIVAAGVAVFM